MPTVRRLFGLAADAVAGGSEYDDLTAGAVPDASEFWPTTGGTLDENVERVGREEEVRGRRPASPPIPFRAAPVVTVPVPAYRSLVEKIFKRTLGGADTVSGTATPYTHTLAALGFGSTALPASHVQLVRDDLNQKMSGGAFQRASFNFPLDGEGTVEVELWGLYAAHFGAAPPSAAFTDLSANPLMLRDAQIFIDGSAERIPDLQGFEFAWVNNLARKWYAKRNVVTQSIGTPVQTKKVWWPSENVLGAAQDVTFAINFGNVNTAQELALVYAQIQKFVFECVGDPFAASGVGGVAGDDLLRITIYNGVWTGGGPEALSARGDITARYEGGAFYSTADNADVKVEVVNGNSAAIT